DDDERLQREPERETGGEQLREAVVGGERDAEPAQHEDHVDEQERGHADEPELLRERGVDEVGAQVRDERVPLRGREQAGAETGARVAAVRDRVQGLDLLVARAVLPKRHLPVERAVHLVRRPRLDPVDDALPHVRRALVHGGGADEEEDDEDEDELQARGRRVEDGEEDPVVEERATEVVGGEEHEHRAAPDDEQRPPVLHAALSQHLALFAQVRREEDDERDLPELAGLELQAAEVDPQPRSVHRLADAGQKGHEQQADRAQAEEVLVVLQQPVVLTQEDERGCEHRHPDDDPEPLLERVRRAEAVDLRQSDRGQEPGQGKEIRVGARNGEPRDDVRGEIQHEEEDCVRERCRRDVRLAGDVDARKADGGEHADEDEIRELAIPEAEGQRISPHSRRETSNARTMSVARTTRTRTAEGPASTASLLARTPTSSLVSSSTGSVTACIVAVSPMSSPSRAPIENATTVMLSSPPPRLAAETSCFVRRSRLSRWCSTASRMARSSTMSVSPSEQMRNTSPSCGCTVNESTSTSGSVPTARVMTDRCGCVSASSAESFPDFRSSFTSE